jgi:hypothetical protein
MMIPGRNTPAGTVIPYVSEKRMYQLRKNAKFSAIES